MARAKNRGYQQTLTPTYTIRRWRLGEYIRLSKEDLKKGKDDSNSVKNQRDLLGDFYRRHRCQPRKLPAALGRCDERENQLRDCERPFPVRPELQ